MVRGTAHIVVAELTTAEERRQAHTNCFAVVSTAWPAGLVPVFAVTTDEGGFELRRAALRGTENFADPLFFALPLEEEAEATRLAGTWNLVATNSNGSKHSMDVQLTVVGDRVAGRFDPSSEYRVAFVSGGTFRSNELQLNVEYSNDRYLLTGKLRGDQVAGSHRQLEGEEQGIWSAMRAQSPAIPSARGVVPLYEWRRGDEKCYSVDPLSDQGWRRSQRPLCRVWRGSR